MQAERRAARVGQDRRRRRRPARPHRHGRCPPRTATPKAPARALIFDSVYDSYRGIVTYIRMEDGELHDREKVHMMGIGMTHDPIEIGVISPDMTRTKALGAGEVGYIITGAKDVSQSKVGDTLTSAVRPCRRAVARLSRPEADGLRRFVPDRQRPVPRTA